MPVMTAMIVERARGAACADADLGPRARWPIRSPPAATPARPPTIRISTQITRAIDQLLRTFINLSAAGRFCAAFRHPQQVKRRHQPAGPASCLASRRKAAPARCSPARQQPEIRTSPSGVHVILVTN